jgi:sedoheptulokinase
MKICGLKKPISHASMSASFGLFDVKTGNFKHEKLSLLGISKEILPEVTDKSIIIGKCRDIPVSVALGDNQASFLGSVSQNKDTMLVNIGTGAQISVVGDFFDANEDIELRPFIEGKYLICGSALCGGFAYSMLESFFKSYTVALGVEESSQYKVMNKLASSAYESGEDGLLVDVSFFGKRSDPNVRGSIRMIDRQNFTPSSLVLGVLNGMCNELYELYEAFPTRANKIIASGGAVRNISVLKKLIAKRFDASVSVNQIKEEASTGVALFSAFVTKKIRYNDGFSSYIS